MRRLSGFLNTTPESGSATTGGTFTAGRTRDLLNSTREPTAESRSAERAGDERGAAQLKLHNFYCFISFLSPSGLYVKRVFFHWFFSHDSSRPGGKQAVLSTDTLNVKRGSVQL